jgi:hypothetical protein
MDPSVDTATTVVTAPKTEMSLITSRAIVDPTLLHSNANAFSRNCVERLLVCSYIRTIRA